MKDLRVIIISLLMCAATGITVHWLVTRQQNGVAVIDAVKLVNGYHMKIELEEMAKPELEAQVKQFDSVGNLLSLAKAAKNEEEVKRLTYTAEFIRTQFEAAHEQSNSDINTQVWKRLNVLLNEYGKKKGLHLIIGANGMGSVLYIDGHYDITDDAISYINKVYAEGN